MTKPETALADAAAAFDEELAAYTRLGDLFVRTPLSSVKHLERANHTLAEIAACEERLQAAGQRMVQALGAARVHQEQLAKDVVAHVPVVQARNRRLNELMAELTAVAGEVGGLNNLITGHRENGDASRPATVDHARDVSATVLALSERAERLAVSARDAEFEELATQAHALHQRLQAIGKKLQSAGG
jgi:predicted  nucleic acid-binding Zn-ribbon protein